MPFIPHTDEEIRAMLTAIGVDSIEELFDEIPQNLKIDTKDLQGIPSAMSEIEVNRLMKTRADENKNKLCFVGAGAYEHHIPAPIWEIAGRGEFMTAYTPYQAEASQGGLQLLYEYQTMMASLTGMEVSNASMYDGASGLAEAVLMAVRCNKKSKSKCILMPSTVHPHYRQTVTSIVSHQGIKIIELPFDGTTGTTQLASLKDYEGEDITALVIPQPNFFGCLEEVDALTDWAKEHNVISIAVVNPMSLALFKEPGKWGEQGVDIVCGEGQPFGSPLSVGGPYFGFLCTKMAYARQMPGRIIGRTSDENGNRGFVLTLQAREQHIRRAKATSNICSNEGLMVAAATIYMSLLGPRGLRKVAAACHAQTRKLVKKLEKLDKVSLRFNNLYFYEVVLHLPEKASEVIAAMDAKNIMAGFDLGSVYQGMENALLVCCTETKTDEDIDLYVKCLEEILK
ncbi:MAG: aminomethyl-transferring glycine dehydrogenase subunit GcvPA [Gammaproteobacteria bacterium]|jgi:glycine dehydrogenase subunit 1